LKKTREGQGGEDGGRIYLGKEKKEPPPKGGQGDRDRGVRKIELTTKVKKGSVKRQSLREGGLATVDRGRHADGRRSDRGESPRG